MNVRLLEPAAQELDEAIAYYNTQVAGLGDTSERMVASRIRGRIQP